MQCIELESILNKLTEQILILAAGLTFRDHEVGLFPFSVNNSFPVFYVLNEITRGLVLVCRMLNFHGIVFYIS